MPRFAFIYRGGAPFKTPEDGKRHMANWRAWRDKLGAAYVYPGMPFSLAVTVSSDGVTQGSGAVRLAGISVVEVDTLEDAQNMARACPHLGIGGDIVVAQGIDMEM